MTTIPGSIRCLLPIGEQRWRAFQQDEQLPVALAHKGAMISACTHAFAHLQDGEDVSFLKMHGNLSSMNHFFIT